MQGSRIFRWTGSQSSQLHSQARELAGRKIPVPRRTLISCHAAMVTLALAANTGVAQELSPEVRARMEAAATMLGELQALHPEQAGNPEQLADDLDYDFAAAIEVATQHVRYEPYTGVLRGADGVVATGAGNAWDQAVFLAALINTMGGDAQIVQGALSDSDAQRLLEQAFKPRDRTPQPGLEQVLDVITRYDPRLADLVRQRGEAVATDAPAAGMDATSQAIGDRLQAVLEQAGHALDPSQPVDTLVSDIARDYVWVRYKEGAAPNWIDVHPAFGDQPAPTPQPQGYLSGEVPEEQQHRVALRLFVERQAGDGADSIERVPVMSRYVRPVAQLYKHQLSLGMIPLDPEPGASSAFLLPVLDDQLAPGAQAVSALGLTVDASALGTGAADLFATVSSGFGRAMDAINTAVDDESGEGLRLTGIWLQIEVISPGGETSVVDRRLADLRETTPDQFPEAAATGMILDTDIGPENSSTVNRRILGQEQNLIRALPTFYGVARQELTLEEARRLPEYRAVDQSFWGDYDLLSTGLLPEPALDSVTFRKGPLLAARRTANDPEQGPVTTSDILFNPSTVLQRNSNGDLVQSNTGALVQGVRETLFESWMMGVEEGWGQRLPQSVLAKPAQLDAHASRAGWHLAAREMAADDLRNGYLLALPDNSEPHWWRIHPQSGETLGMGLHGGQEVAEYLIMAGGAGLSSYFFYRSVKSCDETYSHDREMADCCIVGNLAVTYGTSALGAVRGTAVDMDGYTKELFLSSPFVASAAYIFTALQYEMVENIMLNEVTGKPVESFCRSYLEN